MEDQNFERLKELYHPVFFSDRDSSPLSKETQMKDAMRAAETDHLNASVRDRVMDLIAQYGYFCFTKQEKKSGDALSFAFLPLYYTLYHDFHEQTALIGGYRNCSCSLYFSKTTMFIESFYMDSAGFIRNQNQHLIAENISDFWEYIIEKEYDYHTPISDDVMRIMRNAGWYEGRRINIDALLEECMEDDVFPSDKQIAFVQEFGGLRGSGLIEDVGFCFASKRMRRCFQNISNIAKKDVNSLERKILHEYGADTLCVGYGNEGDFQIFLTAEGQLLIRDIKVGRTIWEGIQCIMGY